VAKTEQALSFAPAELDDLPDLIRNETRSYAFPWTEGVFRDCISGPQDCWVARDTSGNIIGHGILSILVGEAHLLNLCVTRDQQGLGFGRAFMHFLLTQVKDRGAEVLFLEVRPSNRVAIALYESMGFREIGVRKDYYPAPLGREDARVFALQFSGSDSLPSEPQKIGRDHLGAF